MPQRPRKTAGAFPNVTVLQQILLVTRLTQEDVAKRIGISRQTLNAYLTGKSAPSAKSAAALEKLFSLPVSELLKPARIDGTSALLLINPKDSVECPNCHTLVRVL